MPTREQPLDRAWSMHAGLDGRTVDARVGRLRHALEPRGHHARIVTVRGSGCRCVPA